MNSSKFVLWSVVSIGAFLLLGCKHVKDQPQSAPINTALAQKPAPVPTATPPQTKPASPVQIGHTAIKVAGLSEPIALSLQYYPYTKEESDFSEPSDGRQFFTRLLFKVDGKTYEIQSERTLLSLIPPHRPHQVNEDWGTPGLSFDPSNFFRIGEFEDKAGSHTLLFFQGWAYASDPGSVLVIGFKPSGEPYTALKSEMLDVAEFSPGKNEQPARIIGRPSLSQVWGVDGNSGPKDPYATTYDPLAVYVLSDSSGKAKYSLSKSRAYNQEHYVWAGPHVSESYAVLYNIPGHKTPFGANADEAQRIIEKATKLH